MISGIFTTTCGCTHETDNQRGTTRIAKQQQARCLGNHPEHGTAPQSNNLIKLAQPLFADFFDRKFVYILQGLFSFSE